MKNKGLAVLCASMCLVTAVGTLNYFPASVAETAHAEDNASASDKITLNCVGDKAPITLGGTTEVPTWYSDDETIAKVVPTGNLSADIVAVGKGSTSVYAVFSGQIIRFDVTVLRETSDESIVVEVGTATLTNATPSLTMNLTGVDNARAKWASSDTSVAVVDEKGTVTAVGPGKCTVTADYENYTYVINIISEFDPTQEVPTAPSEIFVSEVSLSNDVPIRKIQATVEEGVSVTFSSTDESVAVVEQDGTVTAKGAGKCRIYANIGGVKYYWDVTSTYTGDTEQGNTVIGSVSLTAEQPSRKMTINNLPDGAEIKWSSSDESVAVVTSGGIIIAIGTGKCIVTAEAGGKKYDIEVNVDMSGINDLPITEIKGIGKTVTLQSTGDNVKYVSSDTSVVTVDEKGVVTSVGTGMAVITAYSENSVSYLRIKVVKAGLIGDANCDGSITIADSTAILQHLGNRDKYALSEEGLTNADVDGKEGITASDAISIQKYDAKIINSLPEKA